MNRDEALKLLRGGQPSVGDDKIGGPAGTGGDLIGTIVVLGCHADAELLQICVDGDDNGNITLEQTGCPIQVPAPGYDCTAEGCP